VVACALTLRHNASRIGDYHRRVSLATESITGVVVQPRHAIKDGGDSLVVEWADGGGERRRTFDVFDATAFPVGGTFKLARVPGQDEVYQVDPRANPTAGLSGSMFAVVLVMLLFMPPWLVRFNAWRRSARAPAAAFRATLLLSLAQTDVAMPWLRLTAADGGDDWYQRVMWEPWLATWRGSVDVHVMARARRGPFVVDVPGHGRLWPAGPARSQEQWLETLPVGTFTASPPRRWPTLLGVFAGLAVIVAVAVGGAGDVGDGLLGGLIVGGLGVLLWLFFGGSPRYRQSRS
jgi:hypothetical protein